MRKHLYLITEHEESEQIGRVQLQSSKHAWPDKNKEGDITIRDPVTEEFRDVGKKVCLGYHDFADEQDLEDNAGNVLKKKIRNVDRSWAEKAGVADEVYNE